ncbi:MAG: arginine--tRNA ligase [Candidatus Helarchaeota archaeon]|nr:arginine--tRNA ligase [Candidatus Helarchaeota archaeon]
MENPWVYLQSQILSELEQVLKRLEIDTIPSEKLKNLLEEPPDPKLGDFAITMGFHLAKSLKKAPRQIAEMILNEIQLEKLPYFSKVEVAGAGYINFFIDWKKFNITVLNQIIELKENYGNLSIGNGLKAIVEHTSPNPTKPLHMGTMRCAVLGDITGRILKKAGYNVEIEDYMDDLGRQVAVLTWGFLHLDEKEYKSEKSDAKEDFKLGLLYTKASQEIQAKPELENEVQDLIAKLENDDPEFAQVSAELVEKALKGQLETAWRMNIFYDLLIWESDVIASGIFEETLTRLLQSKNVYKVTEGEDEGCIVVDMSEFGETYQQMEKPYKIIVRSNGVATYTGRDIGLHFFKMNLVKGKFKFRKWGTQPNGKELWETTKEGKYFERFGYGNLTINVIGYEQNFPQQVVNHALKITGYEKEYQNSHHLSFKWVWLPGQQAFSGRKGTWIGFEADAALNKAVELALEEVKKRHEGEFSIEVMNQIAESIGVGAVKYYLAKYNPEKKIVIDWKDVLNFEGESAPYIQYAYVRTQGIFRKHQGTIQNPNPSLLTHESEVTLIRLIAKFPRLIHKVATDFNIHEIANYALELADRFNDFYHQVPVLKAATAELKTSRLQLVQAINILLKILLMDLLGIQVPDRM